MSRIPAELPLSKILPQGAEGGKEFARIVDLLLFYDARKNGGTVTLFSDRSGDTFGLDSFDSHGNGYQYKFFTSPLSSNSRSEIINSLKGAIKSHKNSSIKKWILVTPDDLVNSGRKLGGGDVEWFSKLSADYGTDFSIEHIGHTKLQALFMQAKPLCLHYYPNIIQDGKRHQSLIINTRKQYDDNLRRRYSHIEFVGMSVRKEDATRGLPMENIYIPLEIVAEGTSEDDDKAFRTNPLALTEPGSRTVILGDPGTGKSTLLHFLALVGISLKLQERYKAKGDQRLALLITLRRYADALKTNRNLPLIDYIVDTVRADFSIPDFNSDFIINYLESGRAILLFDGVDELPDLSFKTLVRERVKGMVTSFPGNTAIVTSRIAGYEAEARFSGACAFDHRQMAPLREAEMRSFAEDWHRARTENEKDRQRYVAELMRILTDPESQPIRELARNPLLLTIMVLVHRIDAMLPDERVVLYQKCVETLMVSWQARKSEQDNRRPGKDRADQRHLRRLAAIAQWMHERAGSDGAERRAVVRKADLISMLRDHIQVVERWPGGCDEAEDEAESFLRFVRERAGLLIEAGADLYSFVHLTFQEYLTARHIIILSEAGGDRFIWEKLQLLISNPRWREVVRLLVAERQSEESKRTLTAGILNAAQNAPPLSEEAAIAALAGGLLIDRIPAATERAAEIIACILFSVSKCVDDEASAPSALLTQLAHLMSRDENTGSTWDSAVELALARAGSNQKVRAGIVMTAFTVPLPSKRVIPLMEELRRDDPELAALAEGFLWRDAAIAQPGRKALRRLYEAVNHYAEKSPETNLIASLIAGSIPGQNQLLILSILIKNCVLEIFQEGRGPFLDFVTNSISMYTFSSPRDVKGIDRFGMLIRPELGRDRFRERFRDHVPDRFRDRVRERIRDRVEDRDLAEIVNRIEKRVRDRVRVDDVSWDLFRVRGKGRRLTRNVWSVLAEERAAQDAIIDAVMFPLKLSRAPIWREALRRHFLPTLTDRHTVFRPEILSAIAAADVSERFDGTPFQHAICWLLADTVVDLSKILPLPSQSSFEKLVLLCEQSNHPIWAFIRALRHAWSGDETAVETVLRMIEDPPSPLDDFLTDVGLIDQRPHLKEYFSR